MLGRQPGLGDFCYIRNEGSDARKAASLTLNSAGWENNGTSSRGRCFIWGEGWSREGSGLPVAISCGQLEKRWETEQQI